MRVDAAVANVIGGAARTFEDVFRYAARDGDAATA